MPFRRGVALGARRRLDPRGNRSEIGGEAALIVLGKILIAEHEHRMRMPGVLDLPDRLRLDRATEIDAPDFRANQGVKPAHHNGVEAIGASCHSPVSLNWRQASASF